MIPILTLSLCFFLKSYLYFLQSFKPNSIKINIQKFWFKKIRKGIKKRRISCWFQKCWKILKFFFENKHFLYCWQVPPKNYFWKNQKRRISCWFQKCWKIFTDMYQKKVINQNVSCVNQVCVFFSSLKCHLCKIINHIKTPSRSGVLGIRKNCDYLL